MPERDWNARYQEEQTPWDTGDPAPQLVELVESGALRPGRLLEVGCGTGTNAVWLAQRGFDVVGIDLAPLAIDRAKARAAEAGVDVTFAVTDFLRDDPPSGPFDLAFDRGVFHVFDAEADRARFAARIAAALRTEGVWVSLAGSTEGPARDHGPPRRSAQDLVIAVEPSLEILELRDVMFDLDLPTAARAWRMQARKRAVEAQPSTR